MNIPFKFALSNTNLYGILWNPWGATEPSGAVANAILAAIASLDPVEAKKFDLNAPSGPQRLIGYNIQSLDADCEVSFGLWDTTGSGSFVEIEPAVAVVVAGGGLTRTMFGAGFNIPEPGTKIPVIKFTPATGSATIVGDVEVFAQQAFTPPTGYPGQIETPVAQILDELGGIVLDEAGLSILEN